MIRAIHFIVAVFAVALVGSAAGAQMRGAAPAMRMPSVRVASRARPAAGSTAVSRSVQQVRVMQFSASGRLIPGSSAFANSVNFGTANGVPGLGFDYPHLAAVSGSLHNNRSFGSRRGGHRQQDSFVPILFGGYPFYGDFYGDYGDSTDYSQPRPQQPQPQVIVIQQPVPAAPAPQDLAAGDPAASPPVPSVAAPVRDVGEFVLVRRDGRILFASIFSVAGPQLVYVTPEGIRHTLPLADLDADATREMNEARGSTIQLHN